METRKWETEGEMINYLDIPSLIFGANLEKEPAENSFIHQGIKAFIYSGKNFIIATKGIGKTLLLKAKQNCLMSKDDGAIFVPNDRSLIDFTNDFGSLDKKILGYLKDWKHCEKIWTIALQCSIINYFRVRNNESEFAEIYIKCKSILSDTKDYTPVQTVLHIINLGVTTIEKAWNDISLNIGSLFLQLVHSSIHMFIDSLDLALQSYGKEVWINMQAGLLEAAWHLMKSNHHVQIYTSIRLEAYSNYKSTNKMAIRGSIIILEYTKEDLRKMLKRLSLAYEEKKFSDFIGIDEFKHPELKYNVNTFDYILNHTISRPRDIIAMLSDYYKPEDEEGVISYMRRHINEAATTLICPQIFEEYSLFFDSMKKDEERRRFFSLINRNILKYSELKEICKNFNEATKDCKKEDCKNCSGLHPFCELYNIGLIGTIEQNMLNEQHFLQPHNLKANNNQLPMNSPYYFLHPCLNEIIKLSHNHLNTGDYIHIPYIHVGHGEKWHEGYKEVIELFNTIDKTDSIRIKEIIEKIISDIMGSKIDSGLSKSEIISKKIADSLKMGEKIIPLVESVLNILVNLRGN